ncbi:preprotein translocase subunit SecE [Tetragenococcus muriaticus]|uniref:Protein translocase subunit SecE n=1 Tax=Tetragenococcus muriaticus 3MR10-3 TaxID=1302648 RepID=A0A091C5J3_9ENTE|nr:preprotein translocase subunit SecE [Tetragenococcus muriaticus]KFN92199.1 preprotein translocase subunit [Tetragenococcus muriaticus 3MR10-3]GMA47690.1 protein translocase subunit SecE [Tetragenococcus muriaticus]
MKFIRSVKDEMKKVTWPTGKQLRKDTLVVIEMALIFTVIFYIMDTGIQTVFTWILQ